MANRLSVITTRTGDGGYTHLADGRRVEKSDQTIHVLGEVDELNAHLGCVRALGLPVEMDTLFETLQQHLFHVGACLAYPLASFDPNSVLALEEEIARRNGTLPPLKEFILPGGTPAGAATQLARAVCRRAERALAGLVLDHPTPPLQSALQYLNRLSDLLFIMGRQLVRDAGCPEYCWNPQK